MQNSNTKEFIFGVPHLLWLPVAGGDAGAGRPDLHRHAAGRRAARKPPVLLKAGDVAEVEIEGLGVLRNPVVAG